MNRSLSAISLALVFVLVVACSPTSSSQQPITQAQPAKTQSEPITAVPAIPEISIDAADFSYTSPDTIASGWVRVKLTNSGAEPHHVQFLRLNDGVSNEQFQKALKQGEGPVLALVQQMGGVGAIAPGGLAQVILNLPAGDYVILCFVPSPNDHLPHLAKGMIAPLKVNDSTGPSAAEPVASLIVNLKDFQFELPDAIPAGKTVIKVVNEGPEPHEINLLQLAEGKTIEDVKAFLANPQGMPPFRPVGGMNGLSMGLSGYIEFDFLPGKYIAICNIPSPVVGHAHYEVGMIQEITIK